MASVKATLYTSKKNSDGKNLIAIRVIKDRKPKYYFLDWVDKKYWDKKNYKVKSSHPNARRLNNLINKKVAEADDLILEQEALKKNYTSAKIVELLKGSRKGMTFFQLADEYVSDLKLTGKYTRGAADDSKINYVREFVNHKDIEFHEIDEAFLRKLKVYMMSERGVSERTVMNTYVVIRTLYNLAISQGIIEEKYYPFGKRKIRIKFPESFKIGLNEKELQELEDLELEEGSMIWHSRNVFLFSFYLAGIRVSDVLKMKWSDIRDDRLFYQMSKNSKIDSLKLPAKVLEILEHYKPEQQKDDDFIFPELKKADLKDPKDVHRKIRTANKKFNKYLKKMGETAKIKKNLSMHIARHTFGNIAGDKISPHMLQKLYRHTSLNTTIGYQKNFIYKDADDALDSVVNFGG